MSEFHYMKRRLQKVKVRVFRSPSSTSAVHGKDNIFYAYVLMLGKGGGGGGGDWGIRHYITLLEHEELSIVNNIQLNILQVYADLNILVFKLVFEDQDAFSIFQVRQGSSCVAMVQHNWKDGHHRVYFLEQL